MKNKIITAQYQRLDFGSQIFDFPELKGELSIVWQNKLPDPVERTWLRWYMEKLMLVAAPHGVSFITDKGLSDMKHFDIPLFQLYPGFDSDPVLIAGDGNIYRWSPDSQLSFFSKTNSLPADLLPIGFPGEYVLLTVKRNNVSKLLHWMKPWVTQFVNGKGNRIKWSDNQFLRSCLPGRDGIYLNYGLRSEDMKYVNADGQLLWQCKVGAPISEIIGQANDKVWIRTADGNIIGIHAYSGSIEKMLKLPGAKNPLCVMDEKGRIIICNGINISILDAGDSGNIIFQKSIRIQNGASSSTAHGNEVLITKNDHVIYADFNNRIYSVPFFNDEPGIFLWKAPERIRGFSILKDILVVLSGSFLTGLETKQSYPVNNKL